MTASPKERPFPRPRPPTFHAYWVAFPILLYVITFACFAAFSLSHEPLAWDIALSANLLGFVGSLVAAWSGARAQRGPGTRDRSAQALLIRHVIFHVQAFVFFGLNLGLHAGAFSRTRAELHSLATGEALPPIDAILPVILTAGGLISTLVAAHAGQALSHARRAPQRPLAEVIPLRRTNKSVRSSSRA